jgi:hypothetical protein
MTTREHNIQIYKKQLMKELEKVEKGSERYFSLKKVLKENK